MTHPHPLIALQTIGQVFFCSRFRKEVLVKRQSKIKDYSWGGFMVSRFLKSLISIVIFIVIPIFLWARSEPLIPEQYLKWSKPVVPQILIPQKNPWDVINTQVSLPTNLSCKEGLHQQGNLERRLSFCHNLRNIIVWEDGFGNRSTYNDWPIERKNRLNILFQKLLDEEPSLGLNCADPVTNREIGGLAIYIPGVSALDVYLAHVAHALYLEATDKVPWSFLSRPQIELAELFDSNRYQSIIIERARYRNRDLGGPLLPLSIQPGYDFQKATSRGVYAKNVLLCDPRVGYRFLAGEIATRSTNLIGGTEEETLANITWWFQQNVTHGDDFGDGPDFPQWATLENRLRARPSTEPRSIVAPEGCHHAASLIYDLAKIVNIPLLNAGIGLTPIPSINSFATYNHRGLLFHWGSSDIRILTHIDDIFAERSTRGEIFPIDSEGRPLSENQKIMKFFETHWEQPATLVRWGFHYLPNLPLVTFNDEYDRRARPEIDLLWNEDTDFGQFLGWWTDPSYYPAYNMYNLEKSFQLCDKRIVNFVCRSTRDFPVYALTTSWISMVPVWRTEAEYHSRADACIAAYGGCTRVMALQDQWEASVGQRVWPSTR